MKYTVSLLLILFVIMVSANEIDKNLIEEGIRITSTFCGSRGDHFHTGIDLNNRSKKIYSLEEGELIFHNIKRKGGIQYGYGDFLVIENISDNLRFIYSHLEEDSYDLKKKIYNRNDKIGNIGNTGHSTGPHLHLEIHDIKNNKVINPIKKLNILDSIRPTINDIYFIMDDNTRLSLFDGNYKIKKGGKLFVKCWDQINGSSYLLTPYKISLIVDGKEKANIVFDYLLKKDGKFFIDGDRGFNDIYENKNNHDFFLMDFSSLPGIIGFKVVVEDFSGNRSEYRKALRILLPDKPGKSNKNEE